MNFLKINADFQPTLVLYNFSSAYSKKTVMKVLKKYGFGTISEVRFNTTFDQPTPIIHFTSWDTENTILTRSKLFGGYAISLCKNDEPYCCARVYNLAKYQEQLVRKRLKPNANEFVPKQVAPALIIQNIAPPSVIAISPPTKKDDNFPGVEEYFTNRKKVVKRKCVPLPKNA